MTEQTNIQQTLDRKAIVQAHSEAETDLCQTWNLHRTIKRLVGDIELNLMQLNAAKSQSDRNLHTSRIEDNCSMLDTLASAATSYTNSAIDKLNDSHGEVFL